MIKNDKICYGAWINDDELRHHSSSGGLFSALSLFVFSLKGIVYAVSEENKDLIYKRASSIEDLPNMMGSKYYQANLDTFNLSILYTDIETKPYVLIVGLPCQIGMFHSLIFHKYKKIPQNILLVDLICHGVSSKKIIDIYRHEIEQKYGKLISHKFRTKSNNTIGSQYSSYIFKNGNRKIIKNEDDYYMRLFFADFILRPSCYKCRYAGNEKYSDISIGDFNGARRIIENFPDSTQCISAIIINTAKGKNIIDRITNEKIITTKKTAYDLIAAQNLPLQFPSERPWIRTYVINMIIKLGFIKTCRLLSIKYYTKKFIKKIAGDDAVNFIKKRFKRTIIEN